MQRPIFTILVLAAMILGTATGYWLHENKPEADWKGYVDNFSVITTVFLRLIGMIIAPLVLSTLVAGIAHMGGGGPLLRVAARALAWFLTASVLSLLLGLAIVHVLKPGVGTGLTLPGADATSGVEASGLNLPDFVVHIVPKSLFEAMSNNTIIQIVVFAAFFGVALGSLGEAGKPLLNLTEIVVKAMLKVVNYVMWTAPLAVFAALAATVTQNGLAIIARYLVFVGDFYLALAVLWALLIAAGVVFVGPRLLRLIGMLRDPALLAFSTASSEAAYPRTLEQLENFGVKGRIAGFVLPLGYSFNLDGSMMYCTFAVMFIAQCYGIDLPLATQLTMLAVLMVTSKGMAGVPRASLVVITATLIAFHLPPEGLLLILAVDHFLDMGRSATNVIGNSVATAVVAKWEGQLGPERDVTSAAVPAAAIE